jgi:hypothetical protein
VVFSLVGALVLGLAAYVMRKVFDKRRGARLPLEEEG